MKKRNPLAVFFLGLITFGIYDIYWLVKTKKVLNEKTTHHTPTIWLLILPGVILTAGYAMLFTASILDAAHTASSSKSSSFSSSSSSQTIKSGEQLNATGQRRPAQYIHICDTSDGIEYVTQGDPRCLGSDQYRGDYASSVPGTLYSSPCKTTDSPARYVYISEKEQCPPGAQLVFYNQAVGTPTSVFAGQTSQETPIDQTTHPGLYWGAFGMIAVGFIATFTIGIFWFFRFSKAINEYTRGKMSTAVTFLILWLVHLIGVALIQDTFNETDDVSPAAPNPSGPTTPTVPIQPPSHDTDHPNNGHSNTSF